MQYRPFGSTDFKVSALGLGTMRLPLSRFIPQKVNVQQSIRMMRHAIDKGINYFDTAWPYHLRQSERIVGKALQDGYREKVHLTTKLPMFLISRESEFDFYLNSSLKALQTDHVDTYLFHALSKNTFERLKKLKLLDKMKRARDQGKIKYIGFSFHDTLPVFREIVDHFDWDVVQIQFNYMDTALQAGQEGLEYAASKNMAIVIMEPLKGGQLANPPKEALDVMAASGIERTPVDWALQYLWDRPEVSCVISGMGNMTMINENCASADKSGIESLSEKEKIVIDELVDIYRKNILVPCTDCKYCMPCPFGVNIPLHFATLNHQTIERRFYYKFFVRRSYNALVRNKKRLNRSKTNGHASLCTECGVCIPKCPQGINIPHELKKTLEILDKRKNIKDVFEV
ncbi:MAG: aldo/keto reductase [Candidatus Marinimicrobia bacterium]|nr:aldo/keto reductase [Candidatus Neomarinimicrobiota bacterium]